MLERRQQKQAELKIKEGNGAEMAKDDGKAKADGKCKTDGKTQDEGKTKQESDASDDESANHGLFPFVFS